MPWGHLLHTLLHTLTLWHLLILAALAYQPDSPITLNSLAPQALSSGSAQHLCQEESGAGILFKSKVNYFSNFMPHALCISRYRWQ